MADLKLWADIFSVSMSIVGWSQLILCFRARNKWLRFLPLLLVVGVDLICWLLYILAVPLGMEDSLGVPAITAAVWGLFWVLSALVGWGAHGFVKLIQKMFQ